MQKFRVRPGYRSKELLVEICGDHRASGFPDVRKILSKRLAAKQEKHPELDVGKVAIATDEFISYWKYANGAYEIDDDVYGCFILAPQNNIKIIGDIESVLSLSGLFQKEDVDFGGNA